MKSDIVLAVDLEMAQQTFENLKEFLRAFVKVDLKANAKF